MKEVLVHAVATNDDGPMKGPRTFDTLPVSKSAANRETIYFSTFKSVGFFTPSGLSNPSPILGFPYPTPSGLRHTEAGLH